VKTSTIAGASLGVVAAVAVIGSALFKLKRGPRRANAIVSHVHAAPMKITTTVDVPVV